MCRFLGPFLSATTGAYLIGLTVKLFRKTAGFPDFLLELGLERLRGR